MTHSVLVVEDTELLRRMYVDRLTMDDVSQLRTESSYLAAISGVVRQGGRRFGRLVHLGLWH